MKQNDFKCKLYRADLEEFSNKMNGALKKWCLKIIDVKDIQHSVNMILDLDLNFKFGYVEWYSGRTVPRKYNLKSIHSINNNLNSISIWENTIQNR